MRFIHLLDYFFVLRPVLFFPGWTTTLAGYLAAKRSLEPLGLFNADSSLVLVCISSAMVMGAGFIVNQIKDKESDRINRKLFFLAEGVTHQRLILIETWILVCLSLAIAAFISWIMLLIHVCALLLITVFYNLRPFALKDKPFGSFFANTLMGTFAFMFGWYTVDQSLVPFIASAVPYIFFNTALYFLTTIPDVDGDRLSAKKTVCVVYGIRKTAYWAFAFEIAAVVISFYSMDRVMLLASALTLPFFIRLLLLHNTASAILTIKFGLLFFSLIISIFFPSYIVLIVLFFFLTRFYYRSRFGMNYPNFKGE